MSQPSFLQKDNLGPAGNFVNNALWHDFKRCLMERRPAAAETSDDPSTAASKGHVRNGWEKCIEEIEKLPFDLPPVPENPLDRPAVQDTAD